MALTYQPEEARMKCTLKAIKRAALVIVAAGLAVLTTASYAQAQAELSSYTHQSACHQSERGYAADGHKYANYHEDEIHFTGVRIGASSFAYWQGDGTHGSEGGYYEHAVFRMPDGRLSTGHLAHCWGGDFHYDNMDGFDAP